MRHSFPHFFLFKIKHYPITRKEQNEKPFFFVSKIQNTFFDFDKSQIFSNFNEVIRFINTQEGKHLFKIFLIENHNTRVSCFIMNLQKEIREQKCHFTCPKFG